MYSQLIYYYKNKSKKIEYQKRYNNFHKEKLKNYYKKYYQNNKKKINQRIKYKRENKKIKFKIEYIKTIIYFT